MTNLLIEKPKQADFEGIFRLLKQLWPDNVLKKDVSHKLFLDDLKNKKKEFLVAKKSGQIVGFASLIIRNDFLANGKSGELFELVVDESHVRRKIGTKLVQEIIKIAKAKSCNTLHLYASLHRKWAHAFYKSNNFENTAYHFEKKI